MRTLRFRNLTALLLACMLLGMPAGALGSGGTMDVETISGTIVEGGVECPLLQLESGERVPLAGVRMDAHPVGAKLQLEGRFVRFSICQQGKRTFEVARVLGES